MKKYLLLLITIACLQIIPAQAQNVDDYAVQLNVKIQKAPSAITLKWKLNGSSTSYVVYRKAPSATAWGTPHATLSGTTNTWTDNNVVPGKTYEYHVERIGNGYSGHGYIIAGMNVPAKDRHGKIILIIDDIFSVTLAPELKRLENDLKMEGWQVLRHYVQRGDAVTKVRSLIQADYNADKNNIKTVFLIGHVPVPYSGYFNIDGHADHTGAWPADVFYGDMDGVWNDSDPNADTTGSRMENWNKPGDGKYDEDMIPSEVELEVGRVDMYDLPAFNLSEVELLRRYLNKDHAFRTKLFTAKPQAVLSDNFGALGGEAPGSFVYSAFSSMFGDSNIVNGDFKTLTKKDSYLWSYGAGAGNYEDATGVVKTSQFVTDSFQTVFSLLMGSYFGDWDSKNNLMRASLASRGTTLTSGWAGRPQWVLHHMALGENIGYSTRISQMDTSIYFRSAYGNNFGGLRQTALLGDPTLHLHVTSPVRNFSVLQRKDSTQLLLQWQPATDTEIKGYYIYRTTNIDQPFTRIDSLGAIDTAYLDTTPVIGNNIYMVRAIKLQESASGSYYNLSQGIMDSSIAVKISGLTDNSIPDKNLNLKVYPNPTEGIFYLEPNGLTNTNCTINITDVLGRVIYKQNYANGKEGKISFDLSAYPQGIYLINLTTPDISHTQRLIKNK